MSSIAPSPRSVELIGRSLVALGGLGLLLLLGAQTQGLPASLQFRVVQHAPGWGLAAVALIVCGLKLLWDAGHDQTAWRPARSGKRFQTIVVYSRPDCSLCEEALETLGRYRRWLPPASEVNIDESPVLRDRFGNTMPVVEIDGRIRFQGSISEVLLQRLIEGTPPDARSNRRRISDA
jgi:glutaredoxin